MKSIAEIVVRFTREGFHHWESAPPHRAYLVQSHRHLFHVEVTLEVLGDDREVEFHDLLDFCRAHFPGGDMSGQSCEMLARQLLMTVKEEYPNRNITVGVFEDGEVGARVKT